MKRYRTTSTIFTDAFLCFFVFVSSVLCLLPLLNTLAQSFSSAAAVDAGWVTFWPVQFSLKAYQTLLKEQSFFTAFGVSVLRVIVGGSINMLFIILMSYPLSKEKKIFPQRTFYVAVMLFTMLFSGGLVPWYLTVRNLKLLDKFWALVIPGAVGVYNVILMMNFFRGIPHELEEAALVDGAGPIRTLVSIYLPISTAGLATVALFCCIGHWNSYLDGIILINTPSKMPLQSYVQQFVVNMDSGKTKSLEELQRLMKLNNRTLNAAKLFITMIPILVVYPFLQRYFTKGLVLGAVKG
jgi:putative aldouronate transport system permease protein